MSSLEQYRKYHPVTLVTGVMLAVLSVGMLVDLFPYSKWPIALLASIPACGVAIGVALTIDQLRRRKSLRS